MRTPKDVSIMITAVTKSVIESGADPTKWEERIRQGLQLILKFEKVYDAATTNQNHQPTS